MTHWFVSRHPGAVEWAARRGIVIDRQVSHLDANLVAAGDVVIGTLPVNLAGAVCERGGRYIHLSLDLAPDMRGRELSADDMEAGDARLEEYRIMRVEEMT